MKQTQNKVGLYFRLSQEDERQGESLSIENQRTMLRKYAEERNWEIYDEYIDDGISGTTFDRPEVQRLLDDAKTGTINTIIVKDMSRFGRNYIEVGQYIDYVFPAFGIRFIAIQDNIDTNNRDSGAMEMMPIMNIFNEWHAANTSKKIRAIKKSNALAGVYGTKKARYGYIKGTDKSHKPIIDEEVAPIVVRIFNMYASGSSPKKIAETLNEEGIPSPSKYAMEKEGCKGYKNGQGLWVAVTIREMLADITYLGHLPQLRMTSVSYKNHKRYRKDPSEWAITYNNHEPIISQELWDKVRERQKSVATGKQTAKGYTHPLSGFLFCADCGGKMKLKHSNSITRGRESFSFNCGMHERYGKFYCFSHHITSSVIENIILSDIQEMAEKIVVDEANVREEFLKHNAELTDKAMNVTKKTIKTKQKRLEELEKLMLLTYEDRAKGKMAEDICMKFIESYSLEQKALKSDIEKLSTEIIESETKQHDVDVFINNVKKYLGVPELNRQMCYELLDRVIIGSAPKDKDETRVIDIVYKINIPPTFRD